MLYNFIYGPYSPKDFNTPIWPWNHSPGTTVVTVPEANVLQNPILPPLCPPTRETSPRVKSPSIVSLQLCTSVCILPCSLCKRKLIGEAWLLPKVGVRLKSDNRWVHFKTHKVGAGGEVAQQVMTSNLITWVLSLGATWWEEEAVSHKLSDLPLWAWHAVCPPPMYTIN